MIKQVTESVLMVAKAIRERKAAKKAAAKAERAAMIEAQVDWANDYNNLHRRLAGKKPTVRIEIPKDGGDMKVCK